MGRCEKVRQIGDFVLYDVLYEDNTRTANRKVPSLELNDIDGDLLAKVYMGTRIERLRSSPDDPEPRSNR